MAVILPGDKELDPEPSITKKSLKINLNDNIYGTFAEIGAGQEVVRHLYRAGGASGTVAKSISAYDKNFSDQIYGKEEGKRYVTQNRLHKMLDHEMDLLEKRISRKKHPERFLLVLVFFALKFFLVLNKEFFRQLFFFHVALKYL